MPFGHFIDIEQDLFGGIEASFFTTVFIILLSLFGTGIVIVSITENGYRFVFFENAGLHFGKQRLLKGLGRRKHGI